MKIQIKPLSINEAFQGRRFKTKKYKDFEQEFLLKLKPLKLPKPFYSVYYEFGLSNVLSDWDNPVKPTQDILQQKYGFNDKNIFEALVRKVKVNKGEEYIKFEIKSIDN